MSLNFQASRDCAKDRSSLIKRIRADLYENISPDEILVRLRINPSQVRRELRALLDKYIRSEGSLIGKEQKDMVIARVLDDVLGHGPIESLLLDSSVSEIMINGPRKVFVEREGAMFLTNVVFDDDAHLMNIIDKIVAAVGRRVDESSPMVDARLPDGSRVNVVIPPVALDGPTMTIRKFREKEFTFDELVAVETIPAHLTEYLRSAVIGRKNILVTGGTGAGKTTLLNALSGLIPRGERIVTIEDAAELRLNRPHIVRLESRRANVEGRGAISIRDLVINALRMRPDRIIVGEVRGAEALDMLQAMNTGHDGSMTTAHANSPADAISRLETMVLMTGFDMPLAAVRAQISGAIRLVVHMKRGETGRRVVCRVIELTGSTGEAVTWRQVFHKKVGQTSR